MPLVVVALLVALGVGRLAGGTLGRLGDLPVRRRRLVLAAVVAQVVGVVVGGPVHPLALATSAGLVVAFLVRNRGLRGTGLIALGLLANALVVGANGAMPVSADAAARAGAGIQGLVAGDDRRHEVLGPRTRLPWLSDVVPVPLPGFPHVVSPGDVLVAAGVAQLVVVGMLRPRALPLLPADGRGRQQPVPPPPGRPATAAEALPRARARAAPARDGPS